ncbi:uncharacterized protein [Macrobrachium rosenbergii]|uniref:uncharacterized protein n=1 Tax=Macrobrachium rosenbergii TaxID=79674 RepID=UPI0034D6737E
MAGGCGACIVTASIPDPATGLSQSYSVNSIFQGILPSSSGEDTPLQGCPQRTGLPKEPLALTLGAFTKPASPAWQDTCLPPRKQPLGRTLPFKAGLKSVALQPQGPLGLILEVLGPSPGPLSQPGRIPAFLRGSSLWVGPFPSRPASPAWQDTCLPPGKQPLDQTLPFKADLKRVASLGGFLASSLKFLGPLQVRFPSLPGRIPAFLRGSSLWVGPFPSRLAPKSGEPWWLLGLILEVLGPSPGPLPQPGRIPAFHRGSSLWVGPFPSRLASKSGELGDFWASSLKFLGPLWLAPKVASLASPAWQDTCIPPEEAASGSRTLPFKAGLKSGQPWDLLGLNLEVLFGPHPGPLPQPGRIPAFLRGSSLWVGPFPSRLASRKSGELPSLAGYLPPPGPQPLGPSLQEASREWLAFGTFWPHPEVIGPSPSPLPQSGRIPAFLRGSSLWVGLFPSRPGSPAWQDTCLPPRKQPLGQTLPFKADLKRVASLGTFCASSLKFLGPLQAHFPSLAGYLLSSEEAASGSDPSLQGWPQKVASLGGFWATSLKFLGPLQARFPSLAGLKRVASLGTFWASSLKFLGPLQARFPSLAGYLPSSEEVASGSDPSLQGWPEESGEPWWPLGLILEVLGPSPGLLPQPGRIPAFLRGSSLWAGLKRVASLGGLCASSLKFLGPLQTRFPSLAGYLPSSEEAASGSDPSLQGCPQESGEPWDLLGLILEVLGPSPGPLPQPGRIPAFLRGSSLWARFPSLAGYLPPSEEAASGSDPSLQGWPQESGEPWWPLGLILEVLGPSPGPLPQPGRIPASLQGSSLWVGPFPSRLASREWRALRPFGPHPCP